MTSEWVGATEDWRPLSDETPATLAGDDYWEVIIGGSATRCENLAEVFDTMLARKNDARLYGEYRVFYHDRGTAV